MTETGRIGIGAGLVPGVDLSINPDRGRALAHVPKGILCVKLVIGIEKVVMSF